MDYDGNDSQDHNLKIAGESTSKLSSVLRPYAFPRFELDDSLQGHLRFDSLVETDAFLGIQSQDENHCTAGFSIGSDVIDFSSTATESCSIARQNNLWFDAASSEFAEMLLKSVGQEKIQPKDTVGESNNTCKELGSLEKEMEPIFEQDNANSASTRMSNDNMLQDELLNNVSGLVNQVKTKMLQVEGISLSSEKMDQERECSSQLCPNDLKEECNLPVTREELLPGNDKCLDLRTDIKDIIGSNESSMMSCSQGCQFQLLEGRDKENCPTSQALPGSGQSHILPANKVASASMGGDLLTNNLEQQVTKSGNPNSEQCPRSEANLDLVEELDLKFSSGEVDNVTESSLKEGRQGNLVLERNSKSSMIKGENEHSTNKLSNANIVDPGESLVGPVSCFSTGLIIDTDGVKAIEHVHDAAAVNTGGSRSSGYKEDSEVKADLQSNAIENEDDYVETLKEENISLPTVIIDASSVTYAAPTTDLGASAMIINMCHDEPMLNQLHSENEVKMESGGANCVLNSWKMRSLPLGHTYDTACNINGNGDIHKKMASEAGAACEAKSGVHYSSTTLPVSGTDESLILVMGTCVVSNGSKSPTLNSVQCSKRSELYPNCDDSILNKDSLKHECNSPTIISSAITPPDGCNVKGDGGSERAENRLFTSQDRKGKVASLDDSSFIFKVNLPPSIETEKATTWRPFRIAETYTASAVLEEVSTPDAEKIHGKVARETSGKSPGDHEIGVPNATSGRKRRGSGKGAAKESSREVVIMKETAPFHNKEITSTVSLSSGSSLPGQFTGSIPHVLTNHKSKTRLTKNDVPTSNLPGLSALAVKNHGSPLTAYHQAFTELQQIQLRAQIFVYGSLIQGTAPDEACMISAFQSSGRGVWETIWQVAVERVNRQRSKPAAESPMNSHSSGVKVPELSGRKVSPEINAFPSSVSRAGSKSVPTANLSPSIPSLSPLWSLSTPYHDVSQSSNLQKRPLLQYQPVISTRQPHHTPPVQNIMGHRTWKPQSKAFPNPWVSQPSAVTVNASHSTTAITGVVKLTPVKDFSSTAPSFVKNFPSPSSVYTDTTSTVYARHSQLSDQIKGSISSEVSPAETKPRRRKKAQPLDNTPQNLSYSEAHTETIAASSLPTLTSPLAPVTAPVGFVFSACATALQQVGNVDAGKASTCSMETLPKPRRRKKAQPLDSTQSLLFSQAQTDPIVSSSLTTLTSPVTLLTSAAGLLTTPKSNVVTDCSASQEVRNLDVGKASSYSGELLQKVEDARLLSEEAAWLAATATSHCRSLWNQLAKQDLRMAGDSEAQVAAAAAEAAAAAASVAKVASAAARVASNAALQAKLMADEAFIATKAWAVSQSPTPMSIPTMDSSSNHSHFILVGSKKEVEGKLLADAAAAKQAENLHYIQEASKLAAKALSQAENVVAIGDPFPLKELISAGPEGYLKLPEASSQFVLKPGKESELQVDINNAQAAENCHEECGGSSGGKILDRGRILAVVAKDPSNHSFGNNTISACSISVLNGVGDEDPSGDKSSKVSEVVQSNSGLSVLGSSSGTINAQNNGNNIMEGSLVEVYKYGETLKPAWFSASVLTLNEGKAHVQYTSLLLKEGFDHLEEWVALDGEGDKAPRIRPLLLMTASQSQGTRKRCRSALGNHVWMVGDMVDVRIQDSWYEGIVTDKNENDEATLTVHFPARGETSAVSTQQLRVSRIWTDGNWVQCRRWRGYDSSNESDMPLEKRARLRSPLKKPKSQGVDPVATKPEESELQSLSASCMKFNVGKSSKAETKPKARRPWNSGPGKKRKFLEVSKQFPTSQNAKNNEYKDQVKFAKYLMPHGTASLGGKNLSEVNTKEKPRLKAASHKTCNSTSRRMPKRGNLDSSASSRCDQDASISDSDAEKSAVHEEDTLNLTSLTHHGSSDTIETGKRPEGKSSTTNRSDLANSGKSAPAVGKLTRVEENAYDDNTDSSQAELEPRRSNRRIQPTHKLLEGLQSSSIIPKMTSLRNEKGQGQKSRGAGASSRGK